MVLRGSLSFNGRKMDTVLPIDPSSSMPAKAFENPTPESNIFGPESPLPDPLMNRHLAALKLQKTYKSFRTRRQLADCAILVEHRWWKLLDFAVLKCSSVSFFQIEKPETAVSRWSRARTRAAKVGKGLSQHAKACKLALQHWLEAAYEATVEDGKFMYKLSRKLLDTRSGPAGSKWIFVLSTSNILYVGMKQKGKFQHSSFLAGGATLSAGRLVVIDGILKAVWPHSGHYLPTEENFDTFMSFLEQHQINIQTVKRSPEDEEEINDEKVTGYEMRNSVSEPDITRATEETDRKDSKQSLERHGTCPPLLSRGLNPKITALEIPKKEDIILAFQKKGPESQPEPELEPDSDDDDDDDETTEDFLSSIELMVSKRNLFDFREDAYDKSIPEEKIMNRINSHKETKSLQLAKQLSCRWSTGAGPRIGCVRDYPSELQFQALEEVCLSPKTSSFRFGNTNGERSNMRKKSYSMDNACMPNIEAP
ncbi:hypothetical protein Ccrd_007339 [Cynara cardunculus var. scolymus]|uniref:Uncharacterized protein n=1 Tax=Cynara cardunculus var. scolymus TaxID=59895 RepID=A0A103XHA9_CYNCS|nr:hypothetical protein Ccrd_007339 [Cynara cardunculus var. scolymus]